MINGQTPSLFLTSREQKNQVDNLIISSCENCEVGFTITFKSPSEDRLLHVEPLYINDEVQIFGENEKSKFLNPIKAFMNSDHQRTWRGVVSFISSKKIIVINRGAKVNTSLHRYSLKKSVDSVSLSLTTEAVEALREDLSPSYSTSDCKLPAILFNEADIPPPREPVSDIQFFDERLTDSQKHAVRFALAQEAFCIIKGPPGSGKTTIVCELVRQLDRSGESALICTPANGSLDNIIEILWAQGFRDFLRLGKPSRANPELSGNSIDVLLSPVRSATPRGSSRTFFGNRQQRTGINTQNSKSNSSNYSYGYKKRLEEVLTERKIIFSTLIAASAKSKLDTFYSSLGKRFDVLIIDEVTKTLLACCLIPLPFTKRAIILGDPEQISPLDTLASHSEELKYSLLDLMAHRSAFAELTYDLTEQYRMNPIILKFCQENFYQHVYFDCKTMACRLSDISNLKSWPTLLFIDTSDCRMHETNDNGFYYNEFESLLVSNYVRFLIDHGVSQNSIGVMSREKTQVKLLCGDLEDLPNVSVKHIEGFQGREKDVVIISLVRSNTERTFGENIQKKRLNLAISRAKRHLVIVGDSRTVSDDPLLHALIAYFEAHGKVISPCKVNKIEGTDPDLEEFWHKPKSSSSPVKL